MAHTAHTDEEMMREHKDTAEVLETKMQKLNQMIRESKRIVVFTGAGISTSAGISDFRGPTGVWTRKAQGLPPIAGTSTVKALPTKTHMGIVELHRRGILRYVVSQNCDGLHRRSGLPASAISELHGNSNIEICETCGRRFFRDFSAHRRNRTTDHFTGRFCQCNGRLLESTIDFGQNLPRVPLEKAAEESEKADLHIVFGSSLTVSPACDMPRATAKNGGKLVIVNLQKTPLTRLAEFQIHAPTDVVMESLMAHLGIQIPDFRLERRIIFGLDGNDVVAKAVDVHAPDRETGVLCAVAWDGSVQDIPDYLRTQAVWKSVAHRIAQAHVDIGDLHPTLHFVGHYQEPPLTLDIDLTDGDKDVMIAFDPSSGEWEVTAMQAAQHNKSMDNVDYDCEYGASHREYVISKLRERGVQDPENKADQEFLSSRKKAEMFADEEARDRARNRACNILKNHKKISEMLSNNSTAQAKPVSTMTEVDPRFGSKFPCDSGEGQFQKTPTSEHRENMRNHTKLCRHDGCKHVWEGPWGSFIGGPRGGTHFDLTECPEGKQMNEVFGWNYASPAC
eukprot:TRINITY_DN42945_c0_g1_i1.p1 TRINITY_DN42945_c0_g1~~TRINITY_DN42945_c0_g1_i1.p1  ORF type:complete len:564 (-),score=73.49 TRINITY_DN42945_c0_g1_i1:59-1750(-)